MTANIVLRFRIKQQARGARGEIEAALDATGWPWSLRISRWLDLLLIFEEGQP